MKILTLLSLETASDTQPLYSSGFFFTKASIKLAADVTTPCIKHRIRILKLIFKSRELAANWS